MRGTLRAAVLAVSVLGLSAWPGGGRKAGAETECEGDACSQVTLTRDEAGQKFTARNNSSERWVRVSASNPASYAGACLAPGKEAALNLKSIVGAYRADYAEPKCETPAGR